MSDVTAMAKLWAATQVCNDCGVAWGTPLSGDCTCWEGACDLCGVVIGVSHVRNYGWLRRGMAIAQKRYADSAKAL